MKIITFLSIIILAVIGVTFSILNAAPVHFNYYVGIKEVPLSLLLATSFVLGLLLMFVFMFISSVRLKLQKRHLNKQLKLAEKEVDNLRSKLIKE